MKLRSKILIALAATSIASSLALAQQLPSHQTGASSDGGVVVELCDGVTKTEVKGLKPGQAMSHQQALAVTHSLMTEWERKHPDEHWQTAQASSDTEAASPSNSTPSGESNPAGSTNAPAAEKPSAENAPPAPLPPAQRNPALGGSGHKPKQTQQGDTYASFNERDFKVWQANTDRFVQQGKEVFHSADKLGGTIGISCDMCHPDAANTHPETYPKYQVQLQRVALLRDMIEWCIENPVKGKTMDPNDERLRALEAYIIAQRKGVPLDYGKH